MNIINHLLERKNKYLLIALVLAFAWQGASFISSYMQLLLSKPAPAQVLFVAPEYRERLVGGWEWSNHQNLYAQIEKVTSPAITLQVSVLGILSAGENAFAMLKVANGQEKLYKKGDSISGNIKLAKINLSSVILGDGPNTKEYFIDKQRSNVFLKPLEVKKSNIITNPSSKPVPTKKRVSVASLPKDKRDNFAALENKIKENPLAASNDLDLKAATKGGEVYGYSLNYKIDPALLISIGLLPTDVVISVNGIPTPTLAADQNLVNSLWQESEFTIIYERQGVRNTLNLRK